MVHVGFIGLIPLAASLLFLASRLNWNALALFGVVTTYASCIWRGSSDAPLLASETLLLLYWLLFEGFDLLRVHKQKSGGGLEYVFPINAVAFLALSHSAWLTKNPAQLWAGCAFAACLFLATGIARWFLWATARVTSLDKLPQRMKAGSYEAPVAIGALLAGAAVTFRATGVWLSAGLAIEAEILYVTGVVLDSVFLRLLGRLGFGASLAHLIGNDVSSDEILPGTIAPIHAWTPVAVFHAALFYVNRFLRQPNVIFSSVACALIAGVLARELPARFVGTSWLVFALVLFEIGIRRARAEFRLQAYVLAIGGIVLSIYFHLMDPWKQPWIPLAVGLASVYAFIGRLRLGCELPSEEKSWLERTAAAAITLLSVLFTIRVSPEHYVGLLLCTLAVALLELGRLRLPGALKGFSFAVVGASALDVIIEQSPTFAKFPPVYVWFSYAGAALLFKVFTERAGMFPNMRTFASVLSCAFALATLWLVVPDPFVAPAWAAIAVALFLSGRVRQRAWERGHGYSIALLALVAAGKLGFPWPSALVPVLCYAAEFLTPERAFDGTFERNARLFWSVAGTVALTALLWYEFPGRLLTMAWGVEGIGLLIAGFLLRERILRLQGLAMLLLCIFKLFVYDLRNLETPYRILSFVALGVILLAVSSIYSRFRQQITRHL